jgi:hypothetical protein
MGQKGIYGEWVGVAACQDGGYLVVSRHFCPILEDSSPILEEMDTIPQEMETIPQEMETIPQ